MTNHSETKSSRCEIRVNKDYVNRLVKFKFGTISNYIKKFNMSRMRYWQILNMAHLHKNVKCLTELASNLGVDVEEILL